jgi:hypothetical protein
MGPARWAGRAFLEHVGRLVAEQGSLLGSGGKRVAFKRNAKGELVIAIIVKGIKRNG